MEQDILLKEDSQDLPQRPKGDTGPFIKKHGKNTAPADQKITLPSQQSDNPNPQEYYKLGESYHNQFRSQWELNDLENAIGFTSQAIGLTPDYDPNFPQILDKLGVCHNDRFRRLDELVDIEKSIEYLSRAAALTSDGDPHLLERLTSLGISHGIRFARLGQLSDIEKAIKHTSLVVELTPDDHPSLPSRLTSLGMSHNERFKRLGEYRDLEKAIEFKTRAVELSPSGHPGFPRLLASLGMSHEDRYKRLGELDDIEKAVEYEARAVALTPDDHPILPHLLNVLGASHRNRFNRRGNLGDLEKAIECATRSVTLTPAGSPDLPERLANLGICYGIRFQCKGELKDNEKIIEHLTHAIALTPNGHLDLPYLLVNLGIAHDTRFNRLGELSELDKAIEYETRAVSLTPDGHPRLMERLANLGMSYSNRFKRLGEPVDIKKAIELKSRAVALTPDDDPHLSYRLDSLGASYHDRFNRRGEIGDLEDAIKHKGHAADLTPDGHPALPGRLAGLGASYGQRFKLLSEPYDIGKSIEYISRAIVLTPDGHPSLPERLMNLGIAHNARCRRLGEIVDLEKAIEHTSHALALTPEGHPLSPDMHQLLAVLRLSEYRLTGEFSRLQDTLYLYRKASQSQAGSPGGRFGIALEWAKDASIYSPLNIIEAYQTAIDILPQFVWLGATASQRYRDLERAWNLPAAAASAAIRCSNHTLALEWLEHARCVVWNQSLTLRSPLDQLYYSNPTLADRLQEVASQLHFASSRPRASGATPADSITLEQAGQQHRRLAEEYNGLLSQARKLPGFEDFLQPMKADRLVSAAQNGPVVVINCYQGQCDALIILPGQVGIIHLPLPDFTEKMALHARNEIKSTLWKKGLRERGIKIKPLPEDTGKENIRDILAVLWNGIVKQVLGFLGYLNDVSSDRLPHITWCPTGAVSFLPLHAAGDYDQPQSRVFDYVVSSYIPTLTALLASTLSLLNPSPRVLSIGQESTSVHSALPGTARELAYLQGHIQNRFNYTELVNDAATTTAVLDAMEQHDWVHLACHAHQNLIDPTKSGFFLHDGTLDLSSISRRSFKNKGLAFLSACKTAMGDEELPDEAVHLASGMLMAGYPSVIATMWSVMDEDAPLVADKVYGQLMKNGNVGNGEAGRALHIAVAELREKIGEKEFERWVPYIHIGS
ncbi:unnamed protein product [Rhizoctonia solani]|uniref:CHAT domain-containing protein n=1 Tax=Rhizoctonia solani TaxID=456999 RepID=A0A8H2ZYG4_9AGAM|nr:unnamed protein product [Rhizoctonia solani]